MATHHETHSLWKSPKSMFGTTNAMELGRLYFLMASINLAIAGLYALLIRIELWTPDAGGLFGTKFFDTAVDYNIAMTLHGTGMIFLVIVPLGAGWANYLLPRMVAADNNDMYWPKWNNVAFWMLPIASFFIWSSQAAGAWTGYAPLTVLKSTPGIDLWVVGLVFAGTSSTIGALNFILTIWKGRAPYVKWMEMDLFVWGTLLTSLLVIFATPVLTVALTMVLFDRNFNTSFFSMNYSNPTMYQHIFWFYSHPAVYIMVLPAFGLVSHIMEKFSRRKIFGYTGMVGAMVAIAVLSFMVWVHHMYVTGVDPFVRIAFTTMTFVIAIPSGIKVFNWITTLYGADIKLDVPMLFCLSFIVMFTFGGITGVYLNIVALDLFLHGTYFVVGHFHFVVAAGTLQAMFAAFYYYYPDMTGKMYHKLTAQLNFWTWSIGNLLAFTAFTVLGAEGMPRRYYTYPSQFTDWHRVATIGALFMGFSFLCFLASMFLGYYQGEPANKDDPFELGSGYDFPKPFAEYIKETTGEDLHVEHKLNMWAPAGTLALALPFLAFAAHFSVGVFGTNKDGTEKLLPKIIPNDIWAYLFMVGFVAFMVAFFAHHINEPLDKPKLVDKYRTERNWEIWVFLGTETIFFGALIGTGIAMRLNADQWPKTGEVLAVPITAVNTFILICSSYTMAKSLQAIGKGDQEKLQRNLLYTIALGATFVLVQAYEYSRLVSEGHVTLAANMNHAKAYEAFSSTFFLTTGFHGAHVTVGVIFLIFVYFRARKGGYTKENHEYVEFIGLYWHFVDLVWIILFTILYLM